MILVTGATGLVGGNLIWYLLKENERVSATRRLPAILNHYEQSSVFTLQPRINIYKELIG